jgi:hypothetical protein
MSSNAPGGASGKSIGKSGFGGGGRSWAVDRRAGTHWVELGRYEHKTAAKLAMEDLVAAGEDPDTLRIRKRKD